MEVIKFGKMAALVVAFGVVVRPKVAMLPALAQLILTPVTAQALLAQVWIMA